ncbi:olfactory receptor 1052-like [Coturnix japonica]|uniref:olfactory receptor 1052-like n=1 Tax=Coturnix japonica TaxID=93934 RepID=UPI0007770192|nr:olfactory receptor 1052-like [Coturnix japonica]
MAWSNHSVVTEFTLAGFGDRPELQEVLLVVFLIMYLINLMGNVGMILLINFEPRLHTPMYFFLSHLSFLDISLSSSITPKFLLSLLTGRRTISYRGCLTQIYFYVTFGTSEAFLLAVMSYDRYIAICHPLRYTLVMSQRLCLCLVAICYAAGAINSTVHTVAMLHLSFCASRHLDHFYCEGPLLFALSCSDTSINDVLMLVFTSCMVGTTSTAILLSYGCILYSVLQTRSPGARRKAFSTCTSHLSVTLLFYGAIAFMYMRPAAKRSVKLDKVASIFYTVVTPMLNPFIYSLRNKEVRAALSRVRRKALLMCHRHQDSL